MPSSIAARIIALSLASLALAGCAENRYCATPDTYERAPSIPAIQSAGDIKVSLNPDAYVVPPAPATAVPFGQKIPDPSKTRWSCLDQPPRLNNGTAPAAAPAAKS